MPNEALLGYNPGALGYQTAAGTGASQAQAFNLSGGTNIQDISALINSITRGAQTAANEARIPNAPALERQSSANIASELSGQLPQDVRMQLARIAAENGVARGIAGSPAANLDYLRALGLTSLDLMGRGQSELSAAYARNPGAPLFNPAELLITPAQGAQLGLEQSRLDLQAEQFQQDYALRQQELALQRARGAGGVGRQPAAPGSDRLTPDPYVTQPFYTGGPSVVGLSPYATASGTTGTVPIDPTSAWLASINYSGGGVLPGTGTTTIGPQAIQGPPVPQDEAQATLGQAAPDEYWMLNLGLPTEDQVGASGE